MLRSDSNFVKKPRRSGRRRPDSPARLVPAGIRAPLPIRRGAPLPVPPPEDTTGPHAHEGSEEAGAPPRGGRRRPPRPTPRGGRGRLRDPRPVLLRPHARRRPTLPRAEGGRGGRPPGRLPLRLPGDRPIRGGVPTLDLAPSDRRERRPDEAPHEAAEARDVDRGPPPDLPGRRPRDGPPRRAVAGERGGGGGTRGDPRTRTVLDRPAARELPKRADAPRHRRVRHRGDRRSPRRQPQRGQDPTPSGPAGPADASRPPPRRSPEVVITCRELYDFLHDYLSGELGAAERGEFEAHLAVCPSCVNYLDSYRKTVALGKAAYPRSEDPPPGPVPEELIQAILSARKKKS